MHQQSVAQPAYSLRPLGAPMVRDAVKTEAVQPPMPAVRAVVNGAPVQKLELAREEKLFDLQPVVHAHWRGHPGIVGRSEEHALAGEALEVARHIVNEIVRVEDTLVSTKDEVLDERKGKCRSSQRNFGPKDRGNSMAAVATKIS